MPTKPIRLMLADDHPILRNSLRVRLDMEPDMEVIAEASDGREAVALATRLGPQVVIMDSAMPGLGGVEATRRIRRKDSDVQILALSQYTDQEAVFAMLEAGALGYVPKGSDLEDLCRAIRSVAGGKHYLSPSLSGVLIENYLQIRAYGNRRRAAHPLTSREREVVQMIAEGHSWGTIAKDLGIGERTVESHRRNAMRKLGVKSVAALIKWAIRNGLCDAES